MNTWDKDEVKAFRDNNNTIFIKGPFDIDSKTYAYKFIDSCGEDYCNKQQMVSWNVVMVEDLTGRLK